MKKNLSKQFLVFLSCLGLSGLTAATTLAAFALTWQTKEKPNNGTVGILSYFHCGSGKEDDPFVITRPRHFYNLSLLQNLGAFSSGSYYFQIGYALVSGDSNLYVFDSDTAEVSGTTGYGKVLDMSDYVEANGTNKIIHAIGDHNFPFRSSLTGNDIVVKNLTVQAEPDDVGVFGYVSYEGSVKNLVFEKSTLLSNGYKNTLSEVYVPTSAYDDTCSYTAPGGTAVDLTLADQFDSSDNRNALKNVDVSALSTETFGTFSLKLPTNDPQSSGASIGTTYSVTSSTPFLGLALSMDGKSYSVTVNANLLAATDYATFWDNESDTIISRLYVLANNTLDGLPVSRTVASYEIYIENVTNNSDGTHDLLLGFLKDGYDDNVTETMTQYHHGNNVGCVIGHLDGSATEIYSYDATISLNNNATNATNCSYESLYGLIGETGEHVSGNLNPNKTKKGDVGYLYLDEVYDRVRDDGGTLASGYYHYTPKVYDQSSDSSKTTYCPKEGSLFQNLVRDKNHTFTASDSSTQLAAWASKEAQNSVTFYQRDIIKGRSDGVNGATVTTYDNSLGIFSLVTENQDNLEKNMSEDYDANKTNASIFTLDTGNNVRNTTASTPKYQRILYVTNEVKDPTQDTDVNFYPYDSIASQEYRGDPTPAWPRNYGTSTEKPTKDDYNLASKRARAYLYELKLDTNSTKVERYFHSTHYTYLTKDLENTLLTSQGVSMSANNSLFGVTFRKNTANGTSRTESDVSSFSHYWKVVGRRRIEFCNGDFSGKVSWNPVLGAIVNGNDGYGTTYYDENNTGLKYYPFGQISFKLAKACNVTVVYPYVPYQKDIFNQGGAGHSPYITVCKVDLSIKNPYGGTRYPYAACPIPNSAEVSSLYYYPDGGTDTTAPVAWSTSTDGTPIFAHTFQLEAGSYFISTNVPGYQEPLFYVAVEGQTGGRLGSQISYTISADTLENVDFLVASPSATAVIAYTGDDRKRWYASNRTWCVTNLIFNAATASLHYKSVDVVIDETTTTCFALAFDKSGALQEIDVTNYGGSSSIAGYTQKYVVFCDTSFIPYGDPSLDEVLSYVKS
jgi:hypothetical protein